MTRVSNSRLLQSQEALFKYFRINACHHTHLLGFTVNLCINPKSVMDALSPHLSPLFLDFPQIPDMLCSPPSAYLTLLEFAHLSTVTPQSSHRLLITDVFKH